MREGRVVFGGAKGSFAGAAFYADVNKSIGTPDVRLNHTQGGTRSAASRAQAIHFEGLGHFGLLTTALLTTGIV